MGYETTLIIGEEGVADADGATPIMEFARIDLCNCGHLSKISNIDWKNEDKSRSWYFYETDGNTRVTEDSYGSSPKPVSIETVIAALREDTAGDAYRRFKWALALLESIQNTTPEAKIFFHGH